MHLRGGLHSAVAKERPALEMGLPLFDGQYIDPISLESANDYCI